jgi:hypothetical protein
MTKRAWVEFCRAYPNAHLVAAVVRPARAAHHISRLQRLLNRLIGKLEPSSEFSTAIVRATEVVQIHCGFASKDDADRFAGLAKARAARRIGNWASHCCFRLDAAKELALADALVMVPSEVARR